MKRKILAALLAFCLVLSLFPIGAFATETETPTEPEKPVSTEATVKVGDETATTELVNGVHYVQPTGTLKMVASGEDGSESPNQKKYGYYPVITMPELGENDLIIFSRSFGVANKSNEELNKIISDNVQKLGDSGRVSVGDTLAEWYEILNKTAFDKSEKPYWPEISRDPNVQIVWAHGTVADSEQLKAGETDGSSSPEAEATSSPTEAPTEQPEAPNVTYTSYDRYMFDFNAVTLELPIKLTPVTNDELGKAGVSPVPATELQTGVKTSGSTGPNTTTASGANLVVTGTSNYVDLTWFGTDRTAGNYVALKVEKANEQMPDIKEAYITLSDKTEKKLDPSDNIIIWQFSEEKTEQGIPTNAYIPLKLVYQKEGAEGTSSLRLAINCAQMKLEGPVAKLYPAILTDGWQNQTTREPTATLGEDGKVTITAENLKEHKNGNNTDGHWIGFALTAPAGADKVKYGFDVDEASANAKFEKATPGALEGNVHETESGIAFYADAGAEKPKTVAIVEWYKGDQKILGPTTYTMDLSGVTLAPEGTQLNVTAAVGNDLLGKPDTDIQSDIKATVGADGVIKLTGSSKYIAGWESFSSVLEQQNGHYVALTLAAGEGAKISITSPTEGDQVKEFDTPGTVVSRLENIENNTFTVTVKVTKDGKTETKEYTVDVSGIDRLPGVISKAENQDKTDGAVGVRYAEGTIYLSGGVSFEGDATTAEVKADIFVGETKVHTETLTITKNGEELSVAPTTFEAVGNELTVDIDNLFIKNEDSTADASIAAAPEAKVSDSIPQESQAAATAVLNAIKDSTTEIEKEVLAEYAAKIANDETRTTEDLLKAVPAETKEALAKLENSTNDGIKKIATAVKNPDNYKGSDIKTVVQVRVDIEISGIELGEDGKATSLTLDITPVAETLLTTEANSGTTAPEVLNSTNSDQANAIVISKEPVSIDKPIQVTIKLSDAFAEGNDYVIKHIKENPAGKYFYDGSVDGNHVLTFTSLHGFSQVTVYSTDPRVASIDGVKYDTLQDAVDAVQEGETITLLADAASANITITKLVNFTIDLAGYSIGAITVPSGMKWSNNNGILTFVIDSGSSGGTYYPPAYPGNPTPTPTPTPTANPSAEPTSAPSTEPTADPSAEPTSEPSAEPTVEPTTDPSDVDFKDLNKASNDEARQAIKKAVVMGLLQGYSDGTFRPRNGITRWEFAVVMARADLVKNGAKGTPSELNAMLLKQYPNGCKFTDVMNNSNLSDIVRAGIAYCADHKIMDGRSSATFDPTTGITRQEAALTLAKWAKLNMKDTDLSMFEDGSAVSSWAKGGVKAAYKAGLMKGQTPTKLAPKAKLQREQAAILLVRYFESNNSVG